MNCSTPVTADAWSGFRHRVAVLATMHGKEQVIAPILEQALGIQIIVPSEFDTDQFGTFTREIKRPGDQLEAARLKANQAMQLTRCSLGLASEGAFIPHPALPYVMCDRELVVLIDRDRGWEIVGQVVSTATNYAHQQVTSLAEALAFARKVGFPQHGLVVMPDAAEVANPSPQHPMIKGIVTEADLVAAVEWGLAQADRIHLETDMRAMHNPTRMQVIEQATQDLVQQLRQCCPACGVPGFSVVEHRPGLPCAWCQWPTSLTRSTLSRCQHCQFEQESAPVVGDRFADPAYCAYCNP